MHSALKTKKKVQYYSEAALFASKVLKNQHDPFLAIFLIVIFFFFSFMYHTTHIKVHFYIL